MASSLTSPQEIPLSTAQLCCTKGRVLQYPACQASEPEEFYKGGNPSVSQSFPIYVYLEEKVFSKKAATNVFVLLHFATASACSQSKSKYASDQSKEKKTL